MLWHLIRSGRLHRSPFEGGGSGSGSGDGGGEGDGGGGGESGGEGEGGDGGSGSGGGTEGGKTTTTSAWSEEEAKFAKRSGINLDELEPDSVGGKAFKAAFKSRGDLHSKVVQNEKDAKTWKTRAETAEGKLSELSRSELLGENPSAEKVKEFLDKYDAETKKNAHFGERLDLLKEAGVIDERIISLITDTDMTPAKFAVELLKVAKELGGAEGEEGGEGEGDDDENALQRLIRKKGYRSDGAPPSTRKQKVSPEDRANAIISRHRGGDQSEGKRIDNFLNKTSGKATEKTT